MPSFPSHLTTTTPVPPPNNNSLPPSFAKVERHYFVNYAAAVTAAVTAVVMVGEMPRRPDSSWVHWKFFLPYR